MPDGTDDAKARVTRTPLLRWFECAHLPEHLQAVVAPLRTIALNEVKANEPSQELEAGLRKLLEAKDCFVRAAIEKLVPSDR